MLGTGSAFTNAVGEIWLGANAVIDHYKLQEEPEDSFHIASMFLHSARSGNFSSHSLTFGGGLVRNDIDRDARRRRDRLHPERPVCRPEANS